MSSSYKLIDVLDSVQPMPDYQIYQAAGKFDVSKKKQ